MPPDIQRGMCLLQFTCHFCRSFHRMDPVTPCCGDSAAMKLLCVTCFHIIILPCALFYTHSRKPLIRKTQPAPLPVASPLHRESCDHDFSSSPLPSWFSPELPSLRCSSLCARLCGLTGGGAAITFGPHAGGEGFLHVLCTES